MKRELFAIFKNNQFEEAAYVSDEGFTDDVDRYIRQCKKKYGKINYSYGNFVKDLLPKGYEPRIFIPRPSNRKKKDDVINVIFRRKHAEDDGVNYE